MSASGAASSDGDRAPTTGARAVRRDPVVAAASGPAWAHWVRQLLAAARGRLAAAPLVLIAAFAVEALALGVFGGLADVISGGAIPAVDAAVLSWLEQRANPTLDRVAFFASFVGAELILPLLVLFAALFALQRRWGALISLFVVTFGAQHLDTILKGAFRRVRPNPVSSPILEILPEQAFSFPSGHAMVATSFYLFVGYVGWRLLPPAWRVPCLSAVGFVILCVGLSRLYLGVHYLTDVLAGFAVGAGWTCATILTGHLLALPRRRRAAATQPRSSSSR